MLGYLFIVEIRSGYRCVYKRWRVAGLYRIRIIFKHYFLWDALLQAFQNITESTY